MKIYRKTFFRLFFLMAVLSCLMVDVYSVSNSHAYTIDYLSDQSNSGNNIAKDNDPVNHDQIPYKYKISFAEEPIGHIQVLQNPFLVSDFSASIWQPPKY